MNAHMPTLETHHRMLSVFEDIRSGLMSGPMSLAQLTAVLREKTHPEHRNAPNK